MVPTGLPYSGVAAALTSERTAPWEAMSRYFLDSVNSD